jgi:fimbrial chaperone protein
MPGMRKQNHRPLVLGIAIAALSMAAGPLAAFNLEPIVQDFAPSGDGAVQTFRVTNTGTERIAVRVQVVGRQPDVDGREAMPPLGGLFAVYPERMVLEPAAAQAVRVQWKGPAKLAVEQCFRILAEQLPVDFSTDQQRTGSAIKVLFRYVGAIYVVPAGAKPDVVLESARPAQDGAGRQGLELVFANRGTAHTLLGDLEVTVGGRVLGPEELAGISGENVLPGLARRFFLPLDSGPVPEDAHVTFRYTPVR